MIGFPGVLGGGIPNQGEGGGSGPYSPSTFTANQVLWGNGTGAILSAAPGESIISDNGIGGLTIAAAGSNQGITANLTGTGYFTVNSNTSGTAAAGGVNFTGGASGAQNMRYSGSVLVGLAGLWFNDGGSPSASNYAFIGNSTETALNVPSPGTMYFRVGNVTGASFNGASWIFSTKISSYNAVTSAGWGVPEVVGYGRSTAQTAAVASVAAYTDATGADGSYDVSANVNLTASTTNAFTVTCTYTDETNTSRTLTMGFTQLSGATLLTSITNLTGVGPYESPVYHIRCKASTAITIATVGTFTSVTYNAEGVIRRIA